MALFKSQIEKLKEKKDIEGLIEILYCDSPWGSRKATAVVKALGDLKDVSSVYPLLVALNHKAIGVRGQAVEALGKIGDKRAIKPLLKVKENDEDFQVRNAAIKALEGLGWRPENATEVSPLPSANLTFEAEYKRWDDIIKQYMSRKMGGMDKIKDWVVGIFVGIGIFCTLIIVVGGGIFLFLWVLSSEGPIHQLEQKIADPNLKKAFVGIVSTVVFAIPYILSRGQGFGGKIAAWGGSITFAYALYHLIAWGF